MGCQSIMAAVVRSLEEEYVLCPTLFNTVYKDPKMPSVRRSANEADIKLQVISHAAEHENRAPEREISINAQ